MSLSNTQGYLPVAIALGGNALVTVIKGLAAAASGSSAMLSEAVHSFADTLNQLLLLIGLRRSLRKPDEAFEYGYGNERFFFALISACGIFFIGAGVTAFHGIETLRHPEAIEFNPIVFVVLGVSLVIESYALLAAARELRKHLPDLTWRERIDEADSSTLAVLLEDSVAVLGIFIAAASIALTYATGNGAWDAFGSLAIAALLALVAIVLIVKNRTHLLGRAMPEGMREEVIELLNAEPAIEQVVDFKSSALGLGVYRVKCEVEFNGAALAREMFEDWSAEEQFEEAREDIESFKRAMVISIDRIPRLIGKTIDDVETRLRVRFPGIRHIDIEIN